MAILHPERLTDVHPSLIAVIKDAAAALPFDLTVIEGVRSDEQCYINFGKGRTVAECIKGNCPAKYSNTTVQKVTWLNHALSCNHRKKTDGKGHAVDLYPGTWTDMAKYNQMQDALVAAAKKRGTKIRLGADWNQNGKRREKGETDNPHIELL